MKNPFSHKVTHDHAVTKAFNYEKDGITLSSSLRIDEKKGLKAFEELLVEAIAEVREEIEK